MEWISYGCTESNLWPTTGRPAFSLFGIERLSYMILENEESGSWTPIQVCRNGPNFSHVFFADDLILMAKADSSNARCIKRILLDFCSASGLQISEAKSKVFFSSVRGLSMQKVISDFLGFGVSGNLGKYLGIPLIHGLSGVWCFTTL